MQPYAISAVAVVQIDYTAPTHKIVHLAHSLQEFLHGRGIHPL